jgi:hypothetical protein
VFRSYSYTRNNGCVHSKGVLKFAFDVELVQLGHDGMMILEATMVVVMIMDLMGIMGMLQMTWIFRGLVILRIKIMAIKGMAKNNKGIMEKGGGSHQVQKQVKAPISFGSLHNDVLTEGMKNAKYIVPSDVLQHLLFYP